MDDDVFPSRVRAGRVLFRLGYEASGDRLRRFVARVIEVAESDSRVSVPRLVELCLDGIEDGPLALVASEPDVARLPLARPASTTLEAALLALEVLTEQVLAARKCDGARSTR